MSSTTRLYLFLCFLLVLHCFCDSFRFCSPAASAPDSSPPPLPPSFSSFSSSSLLLLPGAALNKGPHVYMTSTLPWSPNHSTCKDFNLPLTFCSEVNWTLLPPLTPQFPSQHSAFPFSCSPQELFNRFQRRQLKRQTQQGLLFVFWCSVCHRRGRWESDLKVFTTCLGLFFVALFSGGRKSRVGDTWCMAMLTKKR